MIDLDQYLEERIDRFQELKQVVRISGLSGLEELTDDVRAAQFPCIAVDIGADGTLDWSAGRLDRSFHAFHVLIQLDGVTDAVHRKAALQQAFDIGKRILRQIQADSHEYGTPCYGFEASDIRYSSFGPIGFQCYGYSFNFAVSRE